MRLSQVGIIGSKLVEQDAVQVTFEEAGAGVAVAAVGNLSVAFPVTGLAAGDLFIVHFGMRNQTSVPNTPEGFTLLSGPEDNGAGFHFLWYKIASGIESGNLSISVNGDTADVKLARMYRFRGSPGFSLFEGFVSNTGSGSTTLFAPTVTAPAKSLAVCFTYEADNNGFSAFTGESGGDWTLATALFTTSAGSDSALGLHIATFDTAGTVSGGSTTMAASATWGNRALAIRRTGFAPTPPARSGRLYGIAGQSNADGQASVVDIPVDRPELLQIIPRSYVWWIGPNGWGWQPIQAGVVGDSVAGKFGALITLAYNENLKYPSVDKFYVIFAPGGTSMAYWMGTALNFFKSRYSDALANLTVTVFAGFIWIHGESDAANSSAAAAYELNEDDNIVANIFANTGFTRAVVAQLHDELPIGTFPYKGTIQGAKSSNLANGNYGSGGALVSVAGLEVSGDHVHYTANGVIGLGERISTALP